MTRSDRALIIDDEEGLVSVLTMFLEDLEIEAISFGSVESFLSDNLHSDLSDFDILIIDQNLPGTKGLDFIFSLSMEHFPERVFISSGDVITDERIDQNSKVKILSKPYDFNSLEKVFLGRE